MLAYHACCCWGHKGAHQQRKDAEVCQPAHMTITKFSGCMIDKEFPAPVLEPGIVEFECGGGLPAPCTWSRLTGHWAGGGHTRAPSGVSCSGTNVRGAWLNGHEGSGLGGVDFNTGSEEGSRHSDHCGLPPQGPHSY